MCPRRLRFVAIYLSVLALACALLVLDSWPGPPSSPVPWLLLCVVAAPVIRVGEWIGRGILSNALSAAIERTGSWARGTSRFEWWPVLYYVVMCVLFATTTVALVERLIS